MRDRHEAWKLLNLEMLAEAKGKYAEEQARWTAMEKKAEGAITVSGVLIAAAMAFYKELGLNAHCETRLLVLAALAVLVVSIGSAIQALRLKKLTMTAPGGVLGEEIEKLLAEENTSETEFVEASLELLSYYSIVWRDNTKVLRDSIDRKARFIVAAQGGILLSLLFLIISFMYSLVV